jgi:hypothetical protein
MKFFGGNGEVQEVQEADYEFRFLWNGLVQAVHVVRLESDSAACARAQMYLEAAPEFESVVVRSGLRFMRIFSYESSPEPKRFPRLLS